MHRSEPLAEQGPSGTASPETAAHLPLRAAALESLLFDRHSTRAFLPTPLERSRIERILRLAQRTATWSNLQPWHVLVASGQAVDRVRKAIRSAAAAGESSYDLSPPERIDGLYLERRRECGYALYESVGIRRDDREGRQLQAMKNLDFFGAPHVAFISTERRMNDYGHVDAGGYIANFLLAAESQGVATIAQGATATYSRTVREVLNLPPSQALVASIAFGLEDRRAPVNHFRTTRADLSESVSFVDS